MSGRTHSRELKLAVCQQIERGDKRPAQVCREHQLAQTLLLRWRNEYKERGAQAFLPRTPEELSPTDALEKRIAELERHCGQLSLENALLKKLAHKSTLSSGTHS